METLTSSEAAAVLSAAKAQLDVGNVAGYWGVLEQYSTYAGYAKGAATNTGLAGKWGNAHLQSTAKAELGRQLTEAEMQNVRLGIANGDHISRTASLNKEGNITITLDDTIAYHSIAF